MCFQKLCTMFTMATVMLCVAIMSRADVAKSSPGSALDPTLSLPIGESLAVIGVTQGKHSLRRADKKSLQNSLIGFGLTNLVTEALFDTGKFRLFEEKDVRKIEFLEDLVATYWIEAGATYSEDILHSVAMKLGVNLLAYGSVSHARISKRSMSFGPFSKHTQKLRIRVNVCLYQASTGGVLCHEGQGEAQQEAAGVIYEFHGDRLDFETNAAGIATKRAVTLAVQELIADMRFLP